MDHAFGDTRRSNEEPIPSSGRPMRTEWPSRMVSWRLRYDVTQEDILQCSSS